MMIHQILILGASSKESEKFSNHNYDYFKNMYPKEKYVLWTNTEISEFLKNKFDQSVYKSYLKLQPFAFKADLARYCILYELGGWYFDFFTLPLFNYKPSKSFLFFRDFHVSGAAPWAVNNALIFTKPKAPLFMRCIQEIVLNCQVNFYGSTSLFVSGPPILGSAISLDFRNFSSYEFGIFTKENDESRFSFVLPDNQVFARHKDSEGGVFELPHSNNYGEMWRNRQVYSNVTF